MKIQEAVLIVTDINLICTELREAIEEIKLLASTPLTPTPQIEAPAKGGKGKKKENSNQQLPPTQADKTAQQKAFFSFLDGHDGWKTMLSVLNAKQPTWSSPPPPRPIGGTGMGEMGGLGGLGGLGRGGLSGFGRNNTSLDEGILLDMPTNKFKNVH